jgi:Na+/phosphate symporter
MERNLAAVLEFIFLGVTAIFFALWLFQVAYPLIEAALPFEEMAYPLFVNVYFFLTLGFGIVTIFFNHKRKTA